MKPWTDPKYLRFAFISYAFYSEPILVKVRLFCSEAPLLSQLNWGCTEPNTDSHAVISAQQGELSPGVNLSFQSSARSLGKRKRMTSRGGLQLQEWWVMSERCSQAHTAPSSAGRSNSRCVSGRLPLYLMRSAFMLYIYTPRNLTKKRE